VANNDVSSTVSVLLGNGDGTFGIKADFGAGAYAQSVAIGDLNGTGSPNLAVANYGSSTVSVLLGNGDGTFGAKTDFGTGAYPSSVAIGDLTETGNLTSRWRTPTPTPCRCCSGTARHVWCPD